MNLELTSTRHNFEIDPHLHVWGWPIPVYLFLGGLVAGTMVLSGYRLLTQTEEDKDRAWPWTPVLAILLLSLGMGALFMDLTHQLYVWRLYLTFQVTSPMSWGSWILLTVYPALLAAALLHPPRQVWPERIRPWSTWMKERPGVVTGVGLLNLLGGIALGTYTGILLSALGARPLWASAALGPLFLLSGLSSAAALNHLLMMVYDSHRQGRFRDLLMAGLFRLLGKGEDHDTMVRFDNSFLTLELATILLYLAGLASGSAVHQQASQLLLTGDWAPLFWCGVIAVGILFPLLLQSLELYGRIKRTPIPAIMVLTGGFLLRWVMVFAGQQSHWH
ncbi:MAG: NrfD/PsrC family molybdoenzyme membrane anchor subunit [Vulcanimicrobiota bacterium]